MDGPTALASISSQTAVDNRASLGSIGPITQPRQQERQLAGGLRQIMPGTTVVWGRRLPGQQVQLGPGKQGRLVPGVPMQTVVAASSSFSASVTNKPRIVGMYAPKSGPNYTIPAVRQAQQQGREQPVGLKQQHIQQAQEYEEQQDSTAGPALAIRQPDVIEPSEMESDASDSGDLSSDSEGDADELQCYNPLEQHCQYKHAAAAEEQDTADSEDASLELGGQHVKRRKINLES